ncbi:MAG: sulfurtransferase complex subunit TusB [Pseudomonadota bacterium]|jgi:tRNA 2-thiouridine synthesizing protein B|nr:sulfurtransferase complex subunit TusB [Pseudomonadota bacterium]
MLHLVNFPLSEAEAAKRILGRMAPKDVLLFIENGVCALESGAPGAREIDSLAEVVEIYALLPDLKARGIGAASLLQCVQTIDYPGFVTLAVENGPVQSWFR